MEGGRWGKAGGRTPRLIQRRGVCPWIFHIGRWFPARHLGAGRRLGRRRVGRMVLWTEAAGTDLSSSTGKASLFRLFTWTDVSFPPLWGGPVRGRVSPIPWVGKGKEGRGAPSRAVPPPPVRGGSCRAGRGEGGRFQPGGAGERRLSARRAGDRVTEPGTVSLPPDEWKSPPPPWNGHPRGNSFHRRDRRHGPRRLDRTSSGFGGPKPGRRKTRRRHCSKVWTSTPVMARILISGHPFRARARTQPTAPTAAGGL